MYIGNSPGIGTKAYGHDSSQLQIQVKVQINCWASRSASFSYAEALCSLVIKSWFDLCALQLWGCVPCNSGEMHCPCMPVKIKWGTREADFSLAGPSILSLGFTSNNTVHVLGEAVVLTIAEFIHSLYCNTHKFIRLTFAASRVKGESRSPWDYP